MAEFEELKHLHDAGHNILTYDLRNCGMSGEANGNTSGVGFWSAAMSSAQSTMPKAARNLAAMTTGPYSRLAT